MIKKFIVILNMFALFLCKHMSTITELSLFMHICLVVWFQDNDRLKKELFEKSTRIEAQNEKIADLLQRNQK